jgi:hypothetical protein
MSLSTVVRTLFWRTVRRSPVPANYRPSILIRGGRT